MGNINDLIYAYSLGCLDPEDHQKLIDLTDNDLDSKELGEYQNLVSLLPMILTIETPDTSLKDNVAKKLYSLNERKKTVIPSRNPLNENDSPETIMTGNNESLENDNMDDEQQPVKLQMEEETVPHEINNTVVNNNSDISSIEKETEYNRDRIPQNNNSNLTGYRRNSSRYSDSANREPKKLLWGVILLGLLSLGLFIAYIIVSSRTNELNREVGQLKREVLQLNLRLKSAQEMQNLVQSPDIFAINLTGTELSKSGFGKLFIDSVKGLGYIHFGQMPGIADDEAFQLWAKSQGKIISLGTFNVPDKGGYYSFNIQNLPSKEFINFFITQEPASGSSYPGNQVYLKGSYNP